MSKRGSKSAKFTGGKRWGTSGKRASPRNVMSHSDKNEKKILSPKEKILKRIKRQKTREFQSRERRRVRTIFEKMLEEYDIIFRSNAERHLIFKSFFRMSQKKRNKVLSVVDKESSSYREALVVEIDRYHKHSIIKKLRESDVDIDCYKRFISSKSVLSSERVFDKMLVKAEDKGNYSQEEIQMLKQLFLKKVTNGQLSRKFKVQFRLLKKLEVIEEFVRCTTKSSDSDQLDR